MRSMTFNNIRKGWIYLLEGRQKSPYFPMERTFTQTRKGYRLKNTKRGLLQISQPVGFVTEGISSLDLEDGLASWLVTQGSEILQFDDEPGRAYKAVVQNGMDDFKRFANLRDGTIQFIAEESLGQTKSINLITTNQTFLVTGQASTPWKSRTVFTQSASQFTIVGPYDGNITLNYNFIEGDVLEIDYQTRDVYLNGNDLAVAVDLRTDWFELPVGYTTLSASHSTEITYTERYF